MFLQRTTVCKCWLALLLALPMVLRAQDIPWVLPWTDSTPGVTDFSALNPAISTNHVLVDTNGHFSVNGQRVRFLGVNFDYNPEFMPTNSADAYAARLGKFGINYIRMIGMDGNVVVYDYTNNVTTNLNLGNLNLFHNVVSRLKAHGIYSDIALLTYRTYLTNDGLGSEVTNLNSIAESGNPGLLSHVLGYFYDSALQLQKDYATKLLTPTNPYTGLSLAQDPAVASIEIINEEGIFQRWLDGSLDQLPARYATNLQARWNGWLQARYTNDTKMLAAWAATNQPLGTNLLINGSFSNGLTDWFPELHGNAGATFQQTLDFTNNQPSAKVTVTNSDGLGYGWEVQLSYPNLAIVSNQVYTISFCAKSSPATNGEAFVGVNSGAGYDQPLLLTTNWQYFSNTFQASASGSMRVDFNAMGDKLATFWYADVRLKTGGQIGFLTTGASLTNGTVPDVVYGFQGTNYTGNYFGTLAARRDWINFLRDLEYGYYDAMSSYLRTNIGYTGIIMGTTLSTSPGTVQNRLDATEGHYYWPPGGDLSQGLVPNRSIVNAPTEEDNSIGALARQRIKGKPFIVTEYQHENPAYYGAEAQLLLAGYGALQDWDGICFYKYSDYSGADNTMPDDYVPDWFAMGAHPTKMANMLLAANLFRRGDVSISTNEMTMAVTPDEELNLLQNSSFVFGVFSSQLLGVAPQFTFTNRIDISVGTNAVGLTTAPAAPSGNVFGSSTRQLKWDANSVNAGLVTVDTPNTKALVGYADNHVVTFSNLTLQPNTTQLGWCSLGATLTRGTTFTNDCAALIVAGGWWENSGQIWMDTNKDSLGPNWSPNNTNWGRAPVLTEVVPFTLTLPVGTNYVRVWSLDERGHAKVAMSLTGNSTNTILTVTTNAGSIWYELDVAQWRTNFSVSASPSLQSVQPGGSASFTVITATNNSGTVNFGVRGLPSGASASFNPATISGAGFTTLAMTISNSTPMNTYTLTILATNGSSVASNTAALSVDSAANPGTIIWTGGGSSDLNWPNGNNWTNLTTAGYGSASSGAGLPGIFNNVIFTNAGAVASSNVVNNVLTTDTSIDSLMFANTNSYQTTLIQPEHTLSTGALNVGTESDLGNAAVVNATITGAGATLNVNNTASNLVVRQGSGVTGSERATLDLSSLDNFTCNSGRVWVGAQTAAITRMTGTLILARTNVITLSGGAPAIMVGDNGGTAGGEDFLYLGQTNSIFADSITVGRQKTRALLAFAPGLVNPSAYFRGVDGISRVSAWNIGDNSAQSTSGATDGGTNDFSGGTVNALINTMIVGQSQKTTGAGNGVGTLTFDSGNIDVNTLQVGVQYQSGAASAGIGQVNMNGAGATLTVNTMLELGHVAGGGSGATNSGTLNLNGGTLQAANIVGGGGTAIINLNGGTLDLQSGGMTNISTLNVGSNGVAGFALLKNAARVSVSNPIVVAANGTIAGNTIFISPGLTVNGTISPGVSGIGRITNSGPITLSGVTLMELNHIAATNDVLQTGSTLTYGGTLVLTNLAGALTNGDSFKMFYAANYAGAFTSIVPAIPAINLAWNTNSLTSGVLSVISKPTPPPKFGGMMINGSMLVFSGTNGVPRWPYYMLASTNAALPLVNWTKIATNVFDVNGNFTFTNGVNSNQSQRFYLLQLP